MHTTHRMTALATLALALLTLGAPALADTQVRVSSFSYTAEGLLASETVQPDADPNTPPNNHLYKLETVYSYDLWGQQNQRGHNGLERHDR